MRYFIWLLGILAIGLIATVVAAAVPKAFVGRYVGTMTERDGDVNDIVLDLRQSGTLNLTITERDDDDDEADHDRYRGEVRENGSFQFVDLTDDDEIFEGNIKGKSLTGTIKDDGKIEGRVKATRR